MNFATLPQKYPAPVLNRLLRLLLPLLLALHATGAHAQFYNGSQQRFGKNRVQYREFLWQSYRFPEIETYFYKEGRDVAKYVSISAMRNKRGKRNERRRVKLHEIPRKRQDDCRTIRLHGELAMP